MHGKSCDDPGEHSGQVGVRMDVIEFAGCDERGNDRPVLAAAVGPDELLKCVQTPRLSGSGDRSSLALDNLSRCPTGL